jgi:hypothetical protein
MQNWEPQDTMPTASWVWSGAEKVIGNAERKYREYTDLIDVLTHMRYVGVFDWHANSLSCQC